MKSIQIILAKEKNHCPYEHQMMRTKIITSYSFVTDACMVSYEVKYEWTMGFRWA